MSLILEALKKSEAKRRLGEAPDLGTPFATSRRRSGVLPLLLIAIVAAGALGWWFMRAPAPEASASKAPLSSAPATSPKVAAAAHISAPTQVAPTQAPSFDNIAPPASSTMRAGGRHSQAAPVPAAPAHSGTPPQVVSIAERAQSGGYDGRPQTHLSSKRLPSNMHRVAPANAPAVTNTTTPKKPDAPEPAVANTTAAPTMPAPTAAPSAARPTPPAPAVAPAAGASASAPVSGPSTAASSSPATPRAPAPAVTVATASNASVPTPAPAPAMPTPVPPKLDVPFYYELPFSVRKALPTLRLSMHVFAGDPAQRFVVLNDSRLAEGDKTSDEVTLREVRRDGAVLEFQGQRFFYPRDGQ
jgi:hypothetical protein